MSLSTGGALSRRPSRAGPVPAAPGRRPAVRGARPRGPRPCAQPVAAAARSRRKKSASFAGAPQGSAPPCRAGAGRVETRSANSGPKTFLQKRKKKISAHAKKRPAARTHEIMRPKNPPTSQLPHTGSCAASSMVPDTKCTSPSRAQQYCRCLLCTLRANVPTRSSQGWGASCREGPLSRTNAAWVALCILT